MIVILKCWNTISLKYLNNFVGILEMSLINCAINFILIFLGSCVIFSGTGATTFRATDTKLYDPVFP